MSKENWCKIYEVGDKQVLFQRQYDAGEDEYKIHISYICDKMGAFAEMKISYTTEEDQIAMFDERCTQENAQLVIEQGLTAII